MDEFKRQELEADIEEAFFGAIGRNEPRRFTTEFEPAMLLLYKLHEQGFFWRLDSVPNGVICTLQRLVGDLKKPNPERQTFQIGAATIPLAIAEAAMQTRKK